MKELAQAARPRPEDVLPQFAGSKPGEVELPVAPLADEEDARAEVRVALPEPVAAVEVGLVDDAGGDHLVPLEVRQRFEEDPAAVHDPQASRDRVALERVERVGDAV